MKEPRCPGCRGRIIDNDWTDHVECLAEYHAAHRRLRDTPPEPRERTVA